MHLALVGGVTDPTSPGRIVFWVAMGIWGAVELRTAIARPGVDTGEDRGSQRWSLGGTFGGLLAALAIDSVMPEFIPERDHAPFLIVGAILVLAGVAFRIWSIRSLGRFFTYQVMTSEDQHVVTSGPYRWLRHPSYTGLLLSCVGAGVATANPVSLAAVIVIPLIGLSRRVRVEEAALLEALGDDYRRFCASRKRIIPGVW